jgi:hypothetical protein
MEYPLICGVSAALVDDDAALPRRNTHDTHVDEVEKTVREVITLAGTKLTMLLGASSD